MLGVERARATVRVSFGDETTDAELERAIEAISAVLARREDARSSDG
jgi:cysteine sulfinate desulfinase/cysteine desulfurase-like protein